MEHQIINQRRLQHHTAHFVDSTRSTADIKFPADAAVRQGWEARHEVESVNAGKARPRPGKRRDGRKGAGAR